VVARGRRVRPRGARTRVRALLSPLAVRDYRLIWLAQLLSTAGDWATRLALAVVVLHRTGSATMASLVVGASLVAWLGPGQLLAQFADVYGRRLVMLASDVLRAAVFMCLALPVPTWVLLVGVAVAGLAGPPFAAARAAATRELVPIEDYGPAMALAALTVDAGTVLGYVLGGAILAVATPEGALMLNAASFALSAILVARLPETNVRPATNYRTRTVLRAGAAAVFGQPLVRMAVVVGVLAAASGVGVEALVVVYNVRDLHGAAWAPGALLAGVASSSFVVTALLPNSGRRSGLLRSAGLTSLIGAAVAGGGFLTGSHVGAMLAIVASGAFYAVLSPANVVVGPLLPTAVRASAFSVLMGVLVIAQTLGASVSGVLADHMSTAHAAALACLPAAAGGLWVLLMRQVPQGFDDDIETPVRRVGTSPPRPVDREPRLALARRQHARVPERAQVLPAYDGPARVPVPPVCYRSAQAEYEPEYSPRG
jgi:Transmembrane secretion effector